MNMKKKCKKIWKLQKFNVYICSHFKGIAKHHSMRKYFKVENDMCNQDMRAYLEIPMPSHIF